jgi:hypothetical protein
MQGCRASDDDDLYLVGRLVTLPVSHSDIGV